MLERSLGKNNLSVAKVMLAILWQQKMGTVKFFRNHIYFQSFCSDKSKKTILSSLSRLKKAGMIEMKGRYNILLTQAGKEKSLHAYIEAETLLHIQRKHRWDGGWRLIFFNVPERKRKIRDYLRTVIRRIGFKELQAGVWIYPGQVPAFLSHILLRDDVKEHVKLITTGHVDNDQHLKNMFGLK